MAVQEKFKASLLAQSDDFKKLVLSTVEDFHVKGPFSSNVPTSAALATIAGYKDQVVNLREQENVLRKGLTIFKIDQPLSKDIAKLETVRISISICLSNGCLMI